jgi:hypothetical protein
MAIRSFSPTDFPSATINHYRASNDTFQDDLKRFKARYEVLGQHNVPTDDCHCDNSRFPDDG